jgi:hypothetical protein
MCQGKAQLNLVPNPSFEDTASCAVNNPPYIPIFLPVKYWISQGTSDYFNNLAQSYCPAWAMPQPQNIPGYQSPKTGSAYMGIGCYCTCGTNLREIVEVKMDSILSPSKKYCGSLNWSLADSSNYAINNLSLVLSDTSLIANYSFDPTFLTIGATVCNTNQGLLNNTTGWSKIWQTFSPTSNAQYLAIGNFKKDSQITKLYLAATSNNQYDLAYYYVDDISVIQLPDGLDAGSPQAICIGDTINLNSVCSDCWSGIKFQWKDSAGNILSNQQQLSVYPNQTTTYYVNLVDTTNAVPCMIEVIDSVTVTVGCIGINEFQLSHHTKLFPNPAHDRVYYECELEMGETGLITVCDVNGKKIAEQKLEEGGNKITFDTGQWTNNIYVYRVHVNGEMKAASRFIIYK